jgi:recombination protein RecR
MNPIDKLTEYFLDFPGIGPRQAKRFAYHLLMRDQGTLDTISGLIKELKRSIKSCTRCYRFFTVRDPAATTCSVCANAERNHEALLVVPRDNDFEIIERTKAFDGYYFILGGTVPILDKNPEARIRMQKLKDRVIAEKDSLKEIILAANLNPEGENTMNMLSKN